MRQYLLVPLALALLFTCIWAGPARAQIVAINGDSSTNYTTTSDEILYFKVYEAATTPVYSGTIDGNGWWAMEGTGTLEFTGTLDNTGDIGITEGTLLFNGTQTNPDSTIKVVQAGTLILGNSMNGAVVVGFGSALGRDPMGTSIMLANGLKMEAGSILRASPNSMMSIMFDSDHVNSSISPQVDVWLSENDTWAVGDQATLLTDWNAAGPFANFDERIKNTLLGSFRVYGDNGNELRVEYLGATTPPNLTGNQQNTLDGTQGSYLYDRLQNSPLEYLPGNLDHLSGVSHTDQQGISMGDHIAFVNNVLAGPAAVVTPRPDFDPEANRTFNPNDFMPIVDTTGSFGSNFRFDPDEFEEILKSINDDSTWTEDTEEVLLTLDQPALMQVSDLAAKSPYLTELESLLAELYAILDNDLPQVSNAAGTLALINKANAMLDKFEAFADRVLASGASFSQADLDQLAGLYEQVKARIEPATAAIKKLPMNAASTGAALGLYANLLSMESKYSDMVAYARQHINTGGPASIPALIVGERVPANGQVAARPGGAPIAVHGEFVLTPQLREAVLQNNIMAAGLIDGPTYITSGNTMHRVEMGNSQQNPCSVVISGTDTVREIPARAVQLEKSNGSLGVNALLRQQQGAPLITHSGPASSSNLWVSGGGNWGKQRSGGHTTRTNGPSVSAGYDHSFATGWLAGLSFQYADRESKNNNLGSRNDTSTYSFGLYGGYALPVSVGTLRFIAGGAYSMNDVESSRNVQIGLLTECLTAEYDSQAFSVFGEAALSISLDDAASWNVEPYLNLSYNILKTDGFTESGGSARLHSSSETLDHVNSNVGLRLHVALSESFRLGASAGWLHSFGDIDPENTFRFDNATDSFKIRGNGTRNSALFGLNLGWQISNAWALKLSGDLSVNDDSTNAGGYATISFSW